jgi:hypothetical protein
MSYSAPCSDLIYDHHIAAASVPPCSDLIYDLHRSCECTRPRTSWRSWSAPSWSSCRGQWLRGSRRRRCSCRASSSGTPGRRASPLTTSSRVRSARGWLPTAGSNSRTPYSGRPGAGGSNSRPWSGCRTTSGSATPSPGAWWTSRSARLHPA